MGTSYCVPVRLSVIVRVSAIRALSVVALVVDGFRVLRHWLRRHAIAAVDPPRKILKLAALAAEGNPGVLGVLAPAKHAHASHA
jgi:hypothetical protein